MFGEKLPNCRRYENITNGLHAYALEIHPADLFLRNASKSREDVLKFFNDELSPKVREMVERRFPAANYKEDFN